MHIGELFNKAIEVVHTIFELFELRPADVIVVNRWESWLTSGGIGKSLHSRGWVWHITDRAVLNWLAAVVEKQVQSLFVVDLADFRRVALFVIFGKI